MTKADRGGINMIGSQLDNAIWERILNPFVETIQEVYRQKFGKEMN